MKFLPNHKKIMITVTENCNLQCVYCYEKEKNRKIMSFETAKKIIDYAYTFMDGYESMIIELHGGEPFMNFGLIQKIDQYVMEHYPNILVLFRTITNGTLIHGKVQEWLQERKDRYEVMLSLDGRQEQHDGNRKLLDGNGSFGQIDLAFFQKTWDNCPVSMTVNERNLGNLAEGTIWVQELGFECCNAFEWAVEWNLEKSRKILERELNKLVEYYISHPGQELCLLVKHHLADFYDTVDESYRYCVAIDDPSECYDAQGRYAPCQGFMAFVMGSEQKASEFAGFSIHDFAFQDGNLCKGCQLIRLCRICFAANHMLTGDMQNQSPEICLFNRMCIKAGIRIQRERISQKTQLDDSDCQALQAAKEIEQYMEERYMVSR